MKLSKKFLFSIVLAASTAGFAQEYTARTYRGAVPKDSTRCPFWRDGRPRGSYYARHLFTVLERC